jgi:hypothetical protein
MYKKRKPLVRGKAGHVTDVRFMEVEFDAPRGTRMVIELSCGLRLLVADDSAVELAADFINFLRRTGRNQRGGKK